ncbi:MAG: secretin N-terminal domain-containing protein, partial [Pseudomonadota bacterium]
MTMRAVALRRLLLFAALLFSPFVWAEQVTLNFKDTDIQTVTEMVSKITGRNFIVDPRVKGNVTVISSEPLDAEALYATFLSILRVHGFVAIDNGNVVKIMPAATAREEAPVARATAAGDEIQVEVLEVRHAPAAQMVPILRPLVEKEGHLAAHATSNTLIVAASRRTIDKIRGMLVQIDQDTDTEVEAIRLRYAPAEEMVRTLQSLEPTRKGKPAEGGTVTNIVAEPRTNSLLVSGSSGFRERIRKLVKVLDTEVADQRDVHVVYLRYAKAKDLEPIIDQLA